MSEKKLCKCGVEISRWITQCYACREQAIIDAATKVEPSAPLLIIDSDTWFDGLSDAMDEYSGRWAHPCDDEPLSINPKRMAVNLRERVIEDMCEEAFEDAEDQVKGADALEAAFAAALEIFNDAQTARIYFPRVKEVFQIPACEPAKTDGRP